MKHCGVFEPFRPPAALLLMGLMAAPHISANSVIAGGYVPERRNLIVTPIRDGGAAGPDGSRAVAILEIDNNLPDFQLVLEFHPAEGDGGAIEGVRLESLGGVLGRGLGDPSGRPLAEDAGTGRFVWNPGPQETATLGYRVKVMVTCRRPGADVAPVTVSMRYPY